MTRLKIIALYAALLVGVWCACEWLDLELLHVTVARLLPWPELSCC